MFNIRINDLHHERAHKKLNIRHLNGHLDFSSGFQVIDPSNYEKVLKSRKKPEHWCKNMVSKAHSSL